MCQNCAENITYPDFYKALHN
ncbi:MULTISPECIES: hypothetical protein [Nostoc]